MRRDINCEVKIFDNCIRSRGIYCIVIEFLFGYHLIVVLIGMKCQIN